jgi:hypothetical protein
MNFLRSKLFTETTYSLKFAKSCLTIEHVMVKQTLNPESNIQESNNTTRESVLYSFKYMKKYKFKLTRNLTNTIDASQTVVPKCLEFGSYHHDQKFIC